MQLFVKQGLKSHIKMCLYVSASMVATVML